MYTGNFWKATLERAFFTFLEAYFGLWLAGDVIFNAFEFDWLTGLGPALGAAVLMVIKGMLAANTGNAGPSFANEVLTSEAAPPVRRSGH